MKQTLQQMQPGPEKDSLRGFRFYIVIRMPPPNLTNTNDEAYFGNMLVIFFLFFPLLFFSFKTRFSVCSPGCIGA